jgi:hypothetical protein
MKNKDGLPTNLIRLQKITNMKLLNKNDRPTAKSSYVKQLKLLTTLKNKRYVVFL